MVSLDCAGRVLALERPVVMGVLNVTPDSFSDGGRACEPDGGAGGGRAHGGRGGGDHRHRRRIDAAGRRAGHRPRRSCGACCRWWSARPRGCQCRHLRRYLQSRGHAPRAGQRCAHDQRRAGPARRWGAGGRGGEPHGVVPDAHARRAGHHAAAAAVRRSRHRGARLSGRAHAQPASPPVLRAERLCVDPGFGFGKQLRAQSAAAATARELEVLGRAAGGRVCRANRWPGRCWAVGAAAPAGAAVRAPGERLAASLALATIAVLHGARIVRAHDVAATVDAVRVASAVRQEGA